MFCIEIKSFLLIILLFIYYFVLNDFILSLSLFLISYCLFIILNNKKEKFNYKINEKQSLSKIFLKLSSFIYIISLFSTSFIEEEHQIWYYFLSTYFILNTFEKKSYKFLFLLLLSRLIRSWNQTGNKWLNLNDIGDFINQYVSFIFFYLFLFLINRKENVHYLLIIHIISTIIFIYLLNQSKHKTSSYLFGIIVFIYRWNLIGLVSFLFLIR